MKLHLDLSTLPKRPTYGETYGAWLSIFQDLASLPSNVHVIIREAPGSWAPLLTYLRAEVKSTRDHFDHCPMVRAAMASRPLDRTALDVLVGFRPETTEALFKCDTGVWHVAPGRATPSEGAKEFIMTTQGSMNRPEVLQYMQQVLPLYHPTKRKVVLVPCDADKPYPSAIHAAVLALMPEDYYLMVVTGMVGVVPQDLWPVVPHYDGGWRSEWRLMTVLAEYLNRTNPQRVVVFSDFYKDAIGYALHHSRVPDVTRLDGPSFHYASPALLSEENLNLLKAELV